MNSTNLISYLSTTAADFFTNLFKSTPGNNLDNGPINPSPAAPPPVTGQRLTGRIFGPVVPMVGASDQIFRE